MTDETKKIFNAPWQKSFQDWETYKEITIYDSKNQPVCLTRNKEMSNRISRLPELYDAMEEATHVICLRCLANSGTRPPNLAHFKKHCGFDDDCKYCTTKNYWKLLQKVRDGE